MTFSQFPQIPTWPSSLIHSIFLLDHVSSYSAYIRTRTPPSSTLPPPLVAQILDLSGLLPPDVRARRRALNARVVPVALLLLLLRAHLTQARATASARNR